MAASRTTARLLSIALLTVAACSEPTTPNAARPATLALAVGANSKVKVKSVELSTNTLRIEGLAVTASVVIGNSGLAIPTGVSIQATITQGSASREAANLPLVCSGSPGDVGKLPTGNCSTSFRARASNSTTGTGTLVAGSATMVVRVIQVGRGAAAELATKSFAVTLVAVPTVTTPRITSVALQSSILVIGGANVPYTATLQNAGPPQTDVLLQGELEQDQGGITVVKGAGGTLVACGAGLGVLPTTGTGTCTMGFSVAASSSTIGGSLVPGPARFVLHLYKAVPNTTPIEFDKRIIDVTLVPQTPSIVSVIPASSYIVLDKVGAATPVSITLSNPGPALSTVIVQGEIRQGIAIRGAGGANVLCGAAQGTLPNGTCVVSSLQIAANNASGGPGTLVPGAATYVLTLYHFDGVNTTSLDSKTIPITLVANVPSIVSTSLATSTLVINGPRANYSAVLYNPTGATLTGTFVQTYIDQGASSSPAGGFALACTTTSGAMPPGPCTTSFTFGAANTPSTTGVLIAGSAFFRIELWQNSTLLARTSVPITLTSP